MVEMNDIELTAKQRARINRAIKALNEVRLEISTENNHANINWYLEGLSNLNLMNGYTHDNRGHPRHEGVIELFHLDSASGGGW